MDDTPPANDNEVPEPYELANLAWQPHPDRPDVGLLTGHSVKFAHLDFTASLIDDVKKQEGFCESRIIDFTATCREEPDRTFNWSPIPDEPGEGEWKNSDDKDKMSSDAKAVLVGVLNHVEDTYGREPQVVVRENLMARNAKAVQRSKEYEAQAEPEHDGGMDR